MKKKAPKITALGVKYPGTYKGVVAALKSLPPSGGVVHIGKGVSIKLPSPVAEYLGLYVSKAP